MGPMGYGMPPPGFPPTRRCCRQRVCILLALIITLLILFAVGAFIWLYQEPEPEKSTQGKNQNITSATCLSPSEQALGQKTTKPSCSPVLMGFAACLGIAALGVGGYYYFREDPAPTPPPPPPPPPETPLEKAAGVVKGAADTVKEALGLKPKDDPPPKTTFEKASDVVKGAADTVKEVIGLKPKEEPAEISDSPGILENVKNALSWGTSEHKKTVEEDSAPAAPDSEDLKESKWDGYWRDSPAQIEEEAMVNNLFNTECWDSKDGDKFINSKKCIMHDPTQKARLEKERIEKERKIREDGRVEGYDYIYINGKESMAFPSAAQEFMYNTFGVLPFKSFTT